MVVVGPEELLVKGLHDFFADDDELKSIKFIGPKKDGAILEGSKEYAKKFMQKYNIPTASYISVNSENIAEGLEFLKKQSPPFVLKADGLAAGKGVIICDNLKLAETNLREMLGGKFKEASKTVVIEEFLSGIELSVFVFTDGISYKILPEAKDYKRIGEKDSGLNTGGMGAISPVGFASKDFLEKVETHIIKPTISGLIAEKIDYKGFIFFGLMNVDGNPYVIEYNVRMGDPETEVVIPRIKNDILDLFEAIAMQKIHTKNIEIDDRTLATVMLVSEGYPEDYKKGFEIHNIEKVENSLVFHAGTKKSDEKILTNGGRVLAISSFGNDKNSAIEQSNINAEIIDFRGKYYRKDIGFDL
jgi:phosphoribosylamine--glycine ligase